MDSTIFFMIKSMNTTFGSNKPYMTFFSEISNNKNLCILPKQKNVLETVYEATIKDNANEDCGWFFI